MPMLKFKNFGPRNQYYVFFIFCLTLTGIAGDVVNSDTLVTTSEKNNSNLENKTAERHYHNNNNNQFSNTPQYYPGSSGVNIGAGGGGIGQIGGGIGRYCGGYTDSSCSSLCYYRGYTYFQCRATQCYCF